MEDLIYIPESIDNPPSKFGLPDGYYSFIDNENRPELYQLCLIGEKWVDGVDYFNDQGEHYKKRFTHYLRPVPRLTWEREIASKGFKKYEYNISAVYGHTFNFRQHELDYLMECGMDGWELVTIMEKSSDFRYYYFKREIIQQPVNKQP